MSGHSKWATIKHKKAATDAKRGHVFTQANPRNLPLPRVSVAAIPITNPRLRTAILAAKNENMPGDNIERAILRGTGQLEGEQYEEAVFEGYGPGGVGMLIQVVTTNRNRIVGEFRHHDVVRTAATWPKTELSAGCSAAKATLSCPRMPPDEDKLLDIVLEAGAEDMRDDGSILVNHDSARSAG